MKEDESARETRVRLQLQHIDARSALARLAQEEVELARRAESIAGERASWLAQLDRVEDQLTALGIKF